MSFALDGADVAADFVRVGMGMDLVGAGGVFGIVAGEALVLDARALRLVEGLTAETFGLLITKTNK